MFAPQREPARELLERELQRPEYAQARPGLLERAVEWVWDRFDQVQGPGGSLQVAATAVLLTVVLLVIGYAVHRSGGFRRAARGTGRAVLVDGARTAAQYRAEASAHAATPDWDAAVVAGFRAVARGAQERALVREQPGRTARELAGELGSAAPGLRAGLEAAATAFERVSYGRRHVDEADYRVVEQLDRHLESLRDDQLTGTPGSGTSGAGVAP